ncbi:MAG: hypothetical protein KTR20_14025 [Cellvibrionaceae bacterium]|nr:hypothetical protein [Cellvibrionaceae bacterium]
MDTFSSTRTYRRLLTVLLGLAILAYPLIVYHTLDRQGPAVVAAVLLLVFILRFMSIERCWQRAQPSLLLVVGGFCALVIITHSQRLLLYYPSLMNLAMALLFLGSLRGTKPLIARLASAMGQTPPAEAAPYIRKLTALWGLMLLANTGIAAYTACCTSLWLWSLYNGLLSYLLIGLLIIGEWLYRRFFIYPQRKE